MMSIKYNIALLIIVIGTAFYVFISSGVYEDQDILSAAVKKVDSHEHWVERIKEAGGLKAHEDFKNANDQFDIDTQHTNSHIFGAALFEAIGLKGTTICDASYSYGCYHEFLGQAIHSHGIEVVSILNDVCVENLRLQALSCQHGIGHGILSYLGYEFNDLAKALRVCKELPYSDPIGGCYGGLFMEYNMRTMLSVDNIGPRERGGTDNIYEPCSLLGEEFLPACYYWQPQWWLQVLQSGSMASFEAMGELCADLDDAFLERKCFEGVGNIAPQSSGYNPDITIKMCERAAQNPEQELYCRSDAANSFHAVPSVREKAPLVCDGLKGKSEEYCLKHSYNEFNQLNQAAGVNL